MEYTIGRKVFGDWEIVREIGEGSFGKVFELRKTQFGITSKAALKLIRIPKTTAEIREALSDGMDEKTVTSYFKGIVDQFVHEIGVMAELKGHQNIVSCEDFTVREQESGFGWDILIRMELLTALNDYEMQNKLTEEDVRKLAIDMCQALIFCQKKGLIHRDIKPGNIFVDSLGNYKLGDFGVARTAEKTMGGMSKQGTENYMAPEVYYVRPYGASVDIYSLGIVLYRMMNGKRLPFWPAAPAPIGFTDKTEALIKRMKGIEAIPRPVNGSDEFVKIILKACEPDSGKRYRSAGEMLADLKSEKVVSKVDVKQVEKVKEDDSDTAPGIDVFKTLAFTAEKDLRGKTIDIKLDGRKVRFTVPEHVKNGDEVRLAGQGELNLLSGRTGDLVITFEIEEIQTPVCGSDVTMNPWTHEPVGGDVTMNPWGDRKDGGDVTMNPWGDRKDGGDVTINPWGDRNDIGSQNGDIDITINQFGDRKDAKKESQDPIEQNVHKTIKITPDNDPRGKYITFEVDGKKRRVMVPKNAKNGDTKVVPGKDGDLILTFEVEGFVEPEKPEFDLQKEMTSYWKMNLTSLWRPGKRPNHWEAYVTPNIPAQILSNALYNIADNEIKAKDVIGVLDCSGTAEVPCGEGVIVTKDKIILNLAQEGIGFKSVPKAVIDLQTLNDIWVERKTKLFTVQQILHWGERKYNGHVVRDYDCVRLNCLDVDKFVSCVKFIKKNYI